MSLSRCMKLLTEPRRVWMHAAPPLAAGGAPDGRPRRGDGRWATARSDRCLSCLRRQSDGACSIHNGTAGRTVSGESECPGADPALRLADFPRSNGYGETKTQPAASQPASQPMPPLVPAGSPYRPGLDRVPGPIGQAGRQPEGRERRRERRAVEEWFRTAGAQRIHSVVVVEFGCDLRALIRCFGTMWAGDSDGARGHSSVLGRRAPHGRNKGRRLPCCP